MDKAHVPDLTNVIIESDYTNHVQKIAITINSGQSCLSMSWPENNDEMDLAICICRIVQK